MKHRKSFDKMQFIIQNTRLFAFETFRCLIKFSKLIKTICEIRRKVHLHFTTFFLYETQTECHVGEEKGRSDTEKLPQ